MAPGDQVAMVGRIEGAVRASTYSLLIVLNTGVLKIILNNE